MSSDHPASARILSARVSFTPRKLAQPLRLSSGTIVDVIEAQTEVDVDVHGKRGTGHGSVFLSDIWAWPDRISCRPPCRHEEKEQRLVSICEKVASQLPSLVGEHPAFPVELGLRLAQRVREMELGAVPELARILCASPFDAAIHDAVGKALNASAFAFFDAAYDTRTQIDLADAYFPNGAYVAIRETIRRQPITEFESWYVIGRSDAQNEQLANTLLRRGDKRFKLKVLGRDARADAQWVASTFEWVASIAPDAKYLVDANEAFETPFQVSAFLRQLEALSPKAHSALWYLEQPTSRDLLQCPVNWNDLAIGKPIFVDEALTRVELLPVLKRQGWSGIALKTCKGHSLCLVAAAWARLNGLSVSLQDLTNPGYALLHAVLLAGHVPTINGVEINSPQYAPDANRWLSPKFDELLLPKSGKHRLSLSKSIGLTPVESR